MLVGFLNFHSNDCILEGRSRARATISSPVLKHRIRCGWAQGLRSSLGLGQDLVRLGRLPVLWLMYYSGALSSMWGPVEQTRIWLSFYSGFCRAINGYGKLGVNGDPRLLIGNLVFNWARRTLQHVPCGCNLGPLCANSLGWWSGPHVSCVLVAQQQQQHRPSALQSAIMFFRICTCTVL